MRRNCSLVTYGTTDDFLGVFLQFFIFCCLYLRCPRFTLHQQRQNNPDLEYVKLSQQRPRSCIKKEDEIANLPQSVPHEGLNQIAPYKHPVRPHSSVVSDSERRQPLTTKPATRAKSAHPRLVESITPVHTNASTLQLQVLDKNG